MVSDIIELLRDNPYPGRGIVVGLSDDGNKSIVVYFIMGRSENSRNREFEFTDDGIRTKAFDSEKLTDPSLVIYRPVRICDGRTIVTNGDQTDTIAGFISSGQDFRDALLTRVFEPDGPHYTPRISGLVETDGSYRLSILKSLDGDPKCCCRYFYDYLRPLSGLGHFISTYITDGDPLPSFVGEPFAVGINAYDNLDNYAQTIWNALNEDNKVSLYIQETDMSTGIRNQKIINKLTREKI